MCISPPNTYSLEIDGYSLRHYPPSLHAGMLVQNSGHIVNISSINGKSGISLRSSYCASKFALNGLTNAIRYEVSRHTIYRISSIKRGPQIDAALE